MSDVFLWWRLWIWGKNAMGAMLDSPHHMRTCPLLMTLNLITWLSLCSLGFSTGFTTVKLLFSFPLYLVSFLVGGEFLKLCKYPDSPQTFSHWLQHPSLVDLANDYYYCFCLMVILYFLHYFYIYWNSSIKKGAAPSSSFFSVFFRLQLELMATYFILSVIIQCYYFLLLFKLPHPLEAPTSWLLVLPCPIISQRLPSFLVPRDVSVSSDSVNIFEWLNDRRKKVHL